VDDSLETSSNEACDPVDSGTKYTYKLSPVGCVRLHQQCKGFINGIFFLRPSRSMSCAPRKKNLRYWSNGVLESPLMHGRKDQKNANESGNIVSGGLDEQALTRDLKRVVEESDLSIPKIASKMGVFGATLSMWFAGTTKPSRTELLAIKSFLERCD
jgi:hypothetical protein